MPASNSSTLFGSSKLSTRTAFWILFGIGGTLAGVFLFDVYADWIHQDEPLWSTVLENSLLVLLALALPYAGGRLLRKRPDSIHLPEATKWTVLGCVGMILLAGLVIGIQVLQEKIKPVILVFQLAAVGALAGFGVGYNIARVKEAEQEAKDERDRLANLLDGLPAPVVHGTFENGALRILRVNAAFEEVFGPGSEEIEGNNLYELVEPEGPQPEDPEIDRDALDDGPVETVVRARTTDGLRDFQLRVARALGDGAAETYAIYTDITERKAYERQLEQAKEDLERSNRSLREFAYIASHDLQEPLRMVSSYVGLLEDEYGDRLDGEAEEYMEFAVDGAQRMRRMINSLLQYSRVHTKAGPMEPTDANEILDDVQRDLGLLIDEHDGEVSVGDLPTLTADPDQLSQVFQNLVKNAVEHAGRTEEQPQVKVRASERENVYEFAVADNGPGISEAEQEEIFKIFRQGAEATRTSEGTGIGLAISQRIVQRHGGEIWVESEPGEGATFKFTMPKTPAEEQEHSPS